MIAAIYFAGMLMTIGAIHANGGYLPMAVAYGVAWPLFWVGFAYWKTKRLWKNRKK